MSCLKINIVKFVSPSVCPSLPLVGFSANSIFEYFFENMSRKIKIHYNLTRITNTLHGDQHTFLNISRSVRLRMRDVSDKLAEKIKTRILYSITSPPPKKNLAFYEIMWENIAEPDRPQMTIWRMRISHWIP